jgi:hypothetical protein
MSSSSSKFVKTYCGCGNEEKFKLTNKSSFFLNTRGLFIGLFQNSPLGTPFTDAEDLIID